MVDYISDFTQKTYTSKAFATLVEHRIRKDWRIGNIFDKRKKYALVDDNTLTTNLLKEFVHKIFAGHLTMKLVASANEISQDQELLISDCLDTYLAKRLDVFLDKKDFKVFSELVPLRSLTKQECEQLATIWNISGTSIPEEHTFIKNLHAQYKQTKQSMLKSFLALEAIEKSSEK
ncbi:hypothetical protein K9M74_00480 [Candidatus Woesearchaeota archaeon]|nr:hypothetical protein [Candidatus Woesearchaeota archaeon]